MPPALGVGDLFAPVLMDSFMEGLNSTTGPRLYFSDSTTRLQPSFSSVVSELRRRNVDPLSDPDYTLMVRAQDLGGTSDMALSGNARVQIVVQENLWVNPGPVFVRENMKATYPLVITKVTRTSATTGGDRNRLTPTFLSTRCNPTSREPSTRSCKKSGS